LRSSCLAQVTVCLALALVLGAGGDARADALAVVVHPSVEVDDLSFNEFRKIMLADRQFWSTGQRITLIVRAPVSIERTQLLDKVYKMTEPQYRQYWVAKVFRGEATDGPRVVLSNEEAVDLVSLLDGAITVVNSADVPAGLKLLRIDGNLPGDPDYPFN
jgi:hypothetical protein